MVIFGGFSYSEEVGVVEAPRPSEENGISLLYRSGLALDVDGITNEKLEELKVLLENFYNSYNCSYMYIPSTRDDEEGNLRKGHVYYLLDKENFVKIEDFREAMQAICFFIFKDRYSEKEILDVFSLDTCMDRPHQGYFKTIVPEGEVEDYYKKCFGHYKNENGEPLPCLNTSKLLEDFRWYKQNKPEEVNKFFGTTTVSTKANVNFVSNPTEKKTEFNTSYETTTPFSKAFKDMSEEQACKVLEHIGYSYKRHISVDKIEFNKIDGSCEGGVYLQKCNGVWCVKSFHTNTEQQQRGSSLFKFFVRKVNNISDKQYACMTQKEIWDLFYYKTATYIKEHNLMKCFGLNGKKMEKKYQFSKVFEKPERGSSNDKDLINYIRNNFNTKQYIEKLEYAILNCKDFSNLFYDGLGSRLVVKVDGGYESIDSYKMDIFKKIESWGCYHTLSSEAKKVMLINDITGIIKRHGFIVNPLKESLLKDVEAMRDEFKKIKASGGKLLAENFAEDYLGCKRKYANEIFLYTLIKLGQTILFDDGCGIEKIRHAYIDKYLLVLAQGPNKGKSQLFEDFFKAIGAAEYVVSGVDINKPTQKFFADTHPYIFCVVDDALYKKNEFAVSNLKNLGKTEVNVEKKFLEPFKAHYRCSFDIATDNNSLLKLDKNTIRFLPLIPFEGVQGRPTTGIFAEEFSDEQARFKLYRRIMCEVLYLIIYEGYKGFTQLPAAVQNAILEQAQDTIKELLQYDDFDEINIIDEDKMLKEDFIKKSILLVKQYVKDNMLPDILVKEVRNLVEKSKPSCIEITDKLLSEILKVCGYEKLGLVNRRGQKGTVYKTEYYGKV